MDTKTIGLIGTVVKVLIAVLGAGFCIAIIANSDAIEGGDKVQYLDWALRITSIAMILCIGIALLFGLYFFIKNIGKSKGMLFALIGFVLVIVVAYLMADDTVTNAWASKGVTESVSKLSSTGIWATFLLLAIAVVMALWSEVSNLIK